jgi:CRISPR-associated protein Cas2
MKKVADYVVVYDISSHEERNRVDSLLKGYGFRIQKSVFECRLTRKLHDELVRRLKDLRIETGFVRLYRLDYSSGKANIGKSVADKDDGYAFIV